jgi:hypothetical protein
MGEGWGEGISVGFNRFPAFATSAFPIRSGADQFANSPAVRYNPFMPPIYKCPFCGGTQTFGGKIKAPEGFRFCPNQAKTTLWTLISSPGVNFGPSAELCAECGMLWARASAGEARDFLESYGNKSAQARLNEPRVAPKKADHTPPPRLPGL